MANRDRFLTVTVLVNSDKDICQLLPDVRGAIKDEEW